jgi:surface carbohydrate biosynthesis protein (TIGR04326 family)
MSSLLIVWDHKQAPPEGSGETWCWQNYTQQHNVHSILRYVECHATRLRAKYLGFIHTIGESTVSGKRIIDHLAFEDGLSFWWLTVIAEKSLYRSPIADAIRLLALEEIIVQQKPGRI